MNRITRDRRLTPDEATTYRTVRERFAGELPELVARHHERESAGLLGPLVAELRSAREAKGLSLADLTARTGLDSATVSRLEAGESPSPTVETLTRYADAVGKRLVVTLVDG